MNVVAEAGLEAEALEPVLPPEGVVAARIRDVAAEAMRSAEGSIVRASGVRGSAGAFLAAELLRAGVGHLLWVTSDGEEARRAADEIAFVAQTDEQKILALPPHETSPYADVHPDRQAAMLRAHALCRLGEGGWRVLVVPAAELLRKSVPPSIVQAATVELKLEGEVNRTELLARLLEGGYVRVPLVEDPGSFAVRGALVDVWPPGRASPVRVEFYGDMVLELHAFDPFEQRAIKRSEGEPVLTSVSLTPVRESILTAETVARARDVITDLADAANYPTLKLRRLVEDVSSGRSFFGADGWLPAYYDELVPVLSLLPRNTLVVLDQPEFILAALRDEETRALDDERAKAELHLPAEHFYCTFQGLAEDLASRRVLALATSNVLGEVEGPFGKFASGGADVPDLAARSQEDVTRAMKAARASKGKEQVLAPLARRIHFWQAHGLRVLLVARAETQAERLVALLRHQNVNARFRSGGFAQSISAEGDGTTAQIVVGPLTRGVLLPAEGLAIVTEEEVFGSRSHRRRETRARDARDKTRPFLEDLRSLKTGDYVVHAEHGIGRYQGLLHKEVGALTVDLLVVEYAAGDKLYLPVYRLQQIQKYSGGESAEPKLDRLGGSTFAKTKARVRSEVRKMADELLRLYAERKANPGHALPSADDDYRAFEATFPFDETPDQGRAIADVNQDLEGSMPMDRLVCGDVGFGKTEVAMRAAFRVAMTGKQVAVLCPTTVLAQQHLRTFEARMRDYPVRIRAMSRFQGAKEQTETLTLLKDGGVDIVIGTHRLLSKDIHFKDLGLLVVDEEQRFGVVHKERIKQIRKAVDVLTLTATPIPRTLQMAVTGIRDLSLITTAPADRRAVRTIVSRMDPQVLREAVQRELGRGGQVFYVYNRIDKLYEKAERLQELVPSARIAVAHGQMSRGGTAQESGVLEQTMLDFVDGRYDILVATAIIESGLDIPRANTMIIDRADLFGLAQLYQLRGRVGRSKERAYCYLIVPPQESMTDEARARVEALERHTELGSGFQIASLDLELRGGGDLLGAEQSGSVASVGFELFCKMLEETVHELRGEEVVHEVDPELSFDVTALLPEDYVGEVGVRLSLYKRLASAVDEAHVLEITEEIEERFGPPPEEVRRLAELMVLKTELRKLRVLGCEANQRSVTLHLREDTPLDPNKILELVRQPRSPYRLTPDMRLTRFFDPTGDAGARNGLANANTLLVELSKCSKDG